MVHSSQWCASSTFLQSWLISCVYILVAYKVANFPRPYRTYSTGNGNMEPSNWGIAGSSCGVVHCHL